MRARPNRLTALAVLVLPLFGAATLVQQELLENREGVRFQPELVPATADRIARLQVPAGLELNVFASDLGNPRMLAAAPDGTVYVTRRESGDVLALRDSDGDGRADVRTTVVDNLPGVHGIAIRDGRMYLATVNTIYVAPMDGSRIGTRSVVFDGLPPGGRHPNRTLKFSPDGQLYVSVGSTCNLCLEPAPLSATIARVPLPAGQPEVFARGLRNTLGFGWHPVSGQMWGMDNGSDWLGQQVPPEELNALRQGADYGWPFLYGTNEIVELTDYPPTFEPKQALRTSVPMVAGYQAHAAPMQLAFYTARALPDEYRNDAFVAMRGSWNRRPPVGYEVVRVRFDPTGTPERIEPFVTGFLIDNGRRTFGRPVGVVTHPDGSLLFGDDANGMLYRVRARQP